MEKFFNQVKQIIDKYENESKETGNNFNVFKTINITTDEVRLHSKFIGELLNPNGSHGQNDKYLRIFFDQLKIDNIDSATSKVEIEKNIGKKKDTKGGRIDLFLIDSNKNSVIIENKIYARDQYNQLLRYNNYKKGYLFYLTLFGTEPSEDSLGNLKIDKDVFLLSYKYDIINWLDECVKQSIKQPLVQSGIQHYIDLIKLLTGQSKNKNMSNDIRDFIAQSKNNLKIGLQIQKNVVEAKIKIQDLFWKRILDIFKENEIYFDSNYKVTYKNISSYYKKSRNRDNYYGYWAKICEKDNYEIFFGIELGDEVYYGFSIDRKNTSGQLDNQKFSNYINFLSELDNSYKTNRWWIGYKYTNPYLNFRTFNSEEIYSLADKDYLDKITKKIVHDAITDIESFTDFLNEEII